MKQRDREFLEKYDWEQCTVCKQILPTDDRVKGEDWHGGNKHNSVNENGLCKVCRRVDGLQQT